MRKSISLNSDSFRTEVMNWYPDWRSIAFCDYISSDIGLEPIARNEIFPRIIFIKYLICEIDYLRAMKRWTDKGELLSIEIWSLCDINWYYEILLVVLSVDCL